MNLKTIEEIKDGMVVFMPSGVQATLFIDGDNIIVEYPEMYRDKYTKEEFDKLIGDGIVLFYELPTLQVMESKKQIKKSNLIEDFKDKGYIRKDLIDQWKNKKLNEAYEQKDQPVGTVYDALTNKKREYVTSHYKNATLRALHRIAQAYPNVKVRQQALTYLDEYGLQEYWDTKAVEDFINKYTKILRVDVPMKEELSNFSTSDGIANIADALALGEKSGVEPIELGNWICVTSLDEKWEALTDKMKTLVLNQISIPVQDGHTSFTDLEILLDTDRDLTIDDIKSLDMFVPGEIQNMLNGGDELHFYLNYEIQIDQFGPQEAFKLKKKKKNKLDELNIRKGKSMKSNKTLKETFKVYNNIDPDAGFVSFDNYDDIDAYLNQCWGEYRASMSKENTEFGTDEDKANFLSNFELEVADTDPQTTNIIADVTNVDPECSDCEEICDDEECTEIVPVDVIEESLEDEEIDKDYLLDLIKELKSGSSRMTTKEQIRLLAEIKRTAEKLGKEDLCKQKGVDLWSLDEAKDNLSDEEILDDVTDEVNDEIADETINNPEEAKEKLDDIDDVIDDLEDFIKTLIDDEEEPIEDKIDDEEIEDEIVESCGKKKKSKKNEDEEITSEEEIVDDVREEEPEEEEAEIKDAGEASDKLDDLQDTIDSLKDFLDTLEDAEGSEEEINEMCMQKLPSPEEAKKANKKASEDDDEYAFKVARKNALANPNAYEGRYTQKDVRAARKEFLNDLRAKRNQKITDVPTKHEDFQDGMLTDVSEIDLPNALADTIETNDEGTILRLTDVMDAVKELKAQLTQAITDIKTEIKTTLQDTKQDIKQDVNDVETRAQDIKSAVDNLTAEEEAIEGEIPEEPVEEGEEASAEETTTEETPAEEENTEEKEQAQESFKESEETENIIIKAVKKILDEGSVSYDTLFEKLADAGFNVKSQTMKDFVIKAIELNNWEDKIITKYEEFNRKQSSKLANKYIRKGFMEDLDAVKAQIDKLVSQNADPKQIKNAIDLADDEEKEEAMDYAVSNMKESLFNTSKTSLLSQYIIK